MCEKCLEIDIEIARYRRIKAQVNDAQLHEAADRLIEKCEAEKDALHPERKMHYRVKVRYRSKPPAPWKWEIYDGDRLITASNECFASQADAHSAGRIALNRLTANEDDAQ